MSNISFDVDYFDKMTLDALEQIETTNITERLKIEEDVFQTRSIKVRATEVVEFDPVLIYLSDFKKQFDFADALLFAVTKYYEPFANIPRNFRKKWNAKVCYDSGGFSFLMKQKSKGKATAARLKQLLKPERTIQFYKALTYRDDDILIQLDLPPELQLTSAQRRKLILTNLKYYQIMLESIKIITPVLHFWTLKELKYSYNKIITTNDPEVMCIGSNLALTFKKANRVPLQVVLERLANGIKMMGDRRIFCLGGGNPNFSLVLFALGVQSTDGTSWRRDAGNFRLYIPERTPISMGSTRRGTGRMIDDKDKMILKELSRNPLYPFSGLNYEELIETFTTKKGASGARAISNAFVTKWEEWRANDYITDPDGFKKYLVRRFSESPYYRRVLKFLDKRIRSNYVQNDLNIFLKGVTKSETAS